MQEKSIQDLQENIAVKESTHETLREVVEWLVSKQTAIDDVIDTVSTEARSVSGELEKLKERLEKALEKETGISPDELPF